MTSFSKLDGVFTATKPSVDRAEFVRVFSVTSFEAGAVSVSGETLAAFALVGEVIIIGDVDGATGISWFTIGTFSTTRLTVFVSPETSSVSALVWVDAGTTTIVAIATIPTKHRARKVLKIVWGCFKICTFHNV